MNGPCIVPEKWTQSRFGESEFVARKNKSAGRFASGALQIRLGSRF